MEFNVGISALTGRERKAATCKQVMLKVRRLQCELSQPQPTGSAEVWTRCLECFALTKAHKVYCDQISFFFQTEIYSVSHTRTSTHTLKLLYNAIIWIFKDNVWSVACQTDACLHHSTLKRRIFFLQRAPNNFGNNLQSIYEDDSECKRWFIPFSYRCANPHSQTQSLWLVSQGAVCHLVWIGLLMRCNSLRRQQIDYTTHAVYHKCSRIVRKIYLNYCI